MGLRVEYLDRDVIRWEQLQDTFAQYTAIAGAATVQPEASVAFRSWRAYLAWACDPTLNVKEFLAGRAAAAVMTSDKDPAEERGQGSGPSRSRGVGGR
jgi:hypothetical protein